MRFAKCWSPRILKRLPASWRAALQDGPAVPDGESYIPQSVAERAASWLGEEIPDLDDIEF